MLYHKHQLFTDRNNYHPDTVVDDKPISRDGILDILNEENDKPLADDKGKDVIDLDIDDTDKSDKSDKDKKDKSDKNDKDDKDDKDDELDELDELEDELDDPDEEKLELVTPVKRREILAKYPTIFKDFPYLEKAYYREQQFTEVFPTIADAKEASEAIKTLINFETDIAAGNTQKLLEGLKSANPKGFNKLVDNYLTTLHTVDKDAYSHVIGNMIKNNVSSMVQSARDDNNEALEIAAQLVYKYFFGKTKWEAPTKLSDDKDDTTDNTKENELKEREQKLVTERFETSRDDLNERLNNAFTSTIDAHIDPKDSMAPYVKKNASREALDMLNELIDKDSRFKTIIDKAWERAAKDNFNKDSLARISSAYRSKAKTLLPAVIKKVRADALKGSTVTTKKNNDDTISTDTRTRSRSNDTRQSQSQSSNGDKGPKKGQSTVDYFLQD